MNNITQFSAPAGRLLLAIIFIMAGMNKITAYSQTQGYMDAMGVPGILLPLVITLELLGGIAIVLGWQTRIVAAALAGFSILAAAIFHGNFADQMQMLMFMKNISIAGGFLLLVANGAGTLALDNRKQLEQVSPQASPAAG